jgi:hypothetical protein
MGLHFDYRIVVGDKAFSWATKKDMPGVGSSIILWEQPVHDSAYALSKKVIIPTGQYGAGVTTLDWVRKGTVNNPEEDPEKFTLTTKRGERYLFKKLPTKYGEKAWLFRNLGSSSNKFLDKSASLIAGAVGTHIVQNVATKAALGHKGVGKYLANAFSQGAHGVVDKSIKARVTRLASGALLPDLAIAHKRVHELGSSMKPLLDRASDRQKVGLRMISEGRISDLVKHKLHEDHVVRKGYEIASKHIDNLPSIETLASKSHHVERLFEDKSHPLVSNLVKNISRGSLPQGKHFKPGQLTVKAPLTGALTSMAVEPAGGALNTLKALTSSHRFDDTLVGKRFNGIIHKQLVFKPIKKGVKSELNGGKNGILSKIKHKVSEIGINPVAAQLKRTSAAFTDALKS